MSRRINTRERPTQEVCDKTPGADFGSIRTSDRFNRVGDELHISLPCGRKSRVNYRHASIVMAYNWICLCKPPEIGYAYAHGPDNTTIYLARLVTGAKKGQFVDHRNRDTLNNLDSNLRICTQSENMLNRIPARKSKSGFKGVHWHKRRNTWIAQTKYKGKPVWLGTFKDKREAAKVFNDFWTKRNPEFFLAS